MGFLKAFGRALMGKPAYTAADVGRQTAGKGQNETPLEQPIQQKPAGPKTVPNVRFGRIECRQNGSRLDVYGDIHNESAEALFLDRVFFLNIKRELDSQLRAGEAKQFLVYSGPAFTRQPNGYAQLEYRKQSDGDYFANYHQVRSKQTGHGWEITELLESGPVKDI